MTDQPNEQPRITWVELFGIDPDYTEGLSVDEFIARNRGESSDD